MSTSNAPRRSGDFNPWITSAPPLDVEPGTGWWARIDDVWIRLRERKPGEEITPTLERELTRLARIIYREEYRATD